MAYEKDPDEIGALWAKTSAKGVEFLSGEIAGVGDVVLFKAKPTERGPAWRVLKSRPREARAPERSAPTAREPVFDDDFERRYEGDDGL